MAVGGIRLQLFTALAIAVLGAALAAAVIAYHVFDRELERTVEARLQMLVAEAGRVLDAGITAGLDIERPQLQERALRNLRPNLGELETVLVADAEGEVIAGSDAAAIGETLPPLVLAAAQARAAPAAALIEAGDDAATTAGAGPVEMTAQLATSLADAERIIVVRPVQSLFGAPSGYVAARLGTAALDQPRYAFAAKLSLLTAGFAMAGLVIAAFAAFWGPWRARRQARAIEHSMRQLYDSIGAPGAAPLPVADLPAGMGGAMADFSTAVLAREHELARRADAVDLLDEAA
jgi:hypothetical protein